MQLLSDLGQIGSLQERRCGAPVSSYCGACTKEVLNDGKKYTSGVERPRRVETFTQVGSYVWRCIVVDNVARRSARVVKV